MGLFSNENEKVKTVSKKNSEEYYERLERKLESHKKVFDEYKTILNKYEERIISEYRESLDVYNDNINSFISMLEKYEERIQWYEEQQDVYDHRAKKDDDLLAEQALDIKNINEQINRLRVQLEDMKEKQVDHLAEDIQTLLARQIDLQTQFSDLDVKKVLNDMSENNESMLTQMNTSVHEMESTSEELKKENKAIKASLQLILWLNVMMLGGIAGALVLIFKL